jgi:hypothetical protein
MRIFKLYKLYRFYWLKRKKISIIKKVLNNYYIKYIEYRRSLGNSIIWIEIIIWSVSHDISINISQLGYRTSLVDIGLNEIILVK